ncbi:hypothetical protein ACF05T_28730 [Streptomyces lateritius]|uniref:Phage tail protein n=1 Tax=Streptomyces lateritius TaxID=67313 RepID=A0ABW6YJU5_9ACTN
MATKIIDVTLATIDNIGNVGVSPKGVMRACTARAVDDDQLFQIEVLYQRMAGQPMHPSGVTGIRPGQSLTYNNITRRLKVSHFEPESEGHLAQMLIFDRDLTQDFVVDGQLQRDVPYQGSFNRKVRFAEIDGIQTITCNYNALSGSEVAKINVNYTVNLVSSSG